MVAKLRLCASAAMAAALLLSANTAHAESVAAQQASASTNAQDPKALVDRARTAAAAGNHAQSEKLLREALSNRAAVLAQHGPGFTYAALSDLGLAIARQERFSEAEPLMREALRGLEKDLGANHYDTLITLNDLGYIFLIQDRFQDALPFLERGFRGILAAKGWADEHTRLSASNLIKVYEQTGQPAKADVMRQEIAAARRQASSGAAGRAASAAAQQVQPTLESARALVDRAKAASADDQYAQAEALYRQAVAEYRALDSGLPTDVSLAERDLGLAIARQGRFAEAEPLMLKAFAEINTHDGPHAYTTLMTLNRLGVLFGLQQRYREAIPYYERSLRGLLLIDGWEGKDTQTVVGNLIRAHENLGDVAAAERLRKEQAEALPDPKAPALAEADQLLTQGRDAYLSGRAAQAVAPLQRAIELFEQTVGADDPLTLEALRTLSSTYGPLEKRADRIPINERIYRSRERNAGPEHRSTVEAAASLAGSLLEVDRHVDAVPLYTKALESFERMLGPDHPRTLAAAASLGRALDTAGRFAEAERLFQRELDALERTLGPGHPDTRRARRGLITFYVLQRKKEARDRLEAREREIDLARSDTPVSTRAAILRNEGRNSDAEQLLVAALETSRRELGPEHEDTVDRMEDLAHHYDLLDRKAEAEKLLLEGFAITERRFGPTHWRTMSDTARLARFYRGLERYPEAERYIRRELEQVLRERGAENFATVYLQGALAWNLQKQGKGAEAEQLYRTALATRTRNLGQAHPQTLEFAESLVELKLELPDQFRSAGLDTARALVEGARRRRTASAEGAAAEEVRTREARTASERFTLFADLAHRAAVLQEAAPQQLAPEVFQALQDATAGEANEAIARMALRRAAERNPTLSGLVAQREQLSTRWAQLADQYTKSLGSSAPDAAATREAIRVDRDRTDAQIQALDRRLRTEFPDYASIVQPQAVDLAAAQSLLQPDEAILLVVPSRYGTHLVAVRRDRIEWRRSEWDKNKVDQAVQRLRFAAGASADVSEEQRRQWEAEARGQPMSFDRGAAYSLYQQVVAPVDPVLSGASSVYVIAGGSLAGLPFSILVTQPPQGGDADPQALRSTSWLADRHALVHLPSVQSLSLLRRNNEPSAASAFAGFGNPVLEGQAVTRGARNAPIASAEEVLAQTRSTGAGAMVANVRALRALTRLPGTADELQAMSDLFRGRSRLFVQHEATETAVRSTDLSSARVITFATHGLTPQDSVRRGKRTITAAEIFSLAEPGLVLTPPARATEQDDGYLAASEVTGLRLNAEWVILSACNSATGDSATAGLSQLARSFFFAGARNLLASHWPVADDVAGQLTTTTIRLEQGDGDQPGLPRAAAFQAAMKAVRMDTSQDASGATRAHPLFWAPFVLIGDGKS